MNGTIPQISGMKRLDSKGDPTFEPDRRKVTGNKHAFIIRPSFKN